MGTFACLNGPYGDEIAIGFAECPHLNFQSVMRLRDVARHGLRLEFAGGLHANRGETGQGKRRR